MVSELSRLSYEPAKSILTISACWSLVGTLPRLIGIATPKPQFVKVMFITDMTMTGLLLTSLAITIYTILHNAKERQKSNVE